MEAENSNIWAEVAGVQKWVILKWELQRVTTELLQLSLRMYVLLLFFYISRSCESLASMLKENK